MISYNYSHNCQHSSNSVPFIRTIRLEKSSELVAPYAFVCAHSKDLSGRPFYSAQSYGFTRQVERAVFNFLKFKNLEQMRAHVATVENSK